MSEQQQQQQQLPQKKKVEWSTNMSLSEPQSVENRSPMWDSEADHMLSYFLDGNGIASPPQVPRLPPHSVSANPANDVGIGSSLPDPGGNPAAMSDRILQHPFRTNNFPARAPAGPSVQRQDQWQPPPTPVIHHYYHPSSSHSNSSTQSSSNPGPSTISPGIPMPPQPPQFPSLQRPPLPHPQQQEQHAQQPQPLDPIQALQQNFVGAQHQPFASGSSGNKTNHQYAFQGYNPAMEDGQMSPALEFGGDHEPLLLPGKGGTPETLQSLQPSKQQPFLSQNHALTNENIPANRNEISGGNASVPVANTDPGIAAKEPAIQMSTVPHMPLHLNQAVIATQKQFAQSIPSSGSVTAGVQPANPNHIVSAAAPMIHPSMAAAALVSANHPFFFRNFTAAYLLQQAEGAEETEEKRAKRLERNRESARKSRRRKKERLSNLEEKVNNLYVRIEAERRRQINSIETAWKTVETSSELLELKQQVLQASTAAVQSNGHEIAPMETEQSLPKEFSRLFIGETEQSIRKEIVEFQYNSLAQHLLPRYQKLLLWMTLQSESYFLTGKEEHSKREYSQKISLGKISSKQLGEEISNSSKKSPGKVASSTALSKQPESSSGNQTACVSDAARFWPLVCFELSISVDQEERFLETLKRYREAEFLQRNASQIVAAKRLASRAKECVLYEIYLAAFRKKKTYRDILTPKQVILYQEWLLSNRDRAKNLLDRRKKTFYSRKLGGFASDMSDGDENDDLTLEKLCRYLEESLKVSKNSPE